MLNSKQATLRSSYTQIITASFQWTFKTEKFHVITLIFTFSFMSSLWGVDEEGILKRLNAPTEKGQWIPGWYTGGKQNAFKTFLILSNNQKISWKKIRSFTTIHPRLHHYSCFLKTSFLSSQSVGIQLLSRSSLLVSLGNSESHNSQCDLEQVN